MIGNGALPLLRRTGTTNSPRTTSGVDEVRYGPPTRTGRTPPRSASTSTPSLARLVLEGQSEALVETSLLRRLSRPQDADEILEALDHRPDVVLGESWRWAAPAELLLGRPPLSLNLADPLGDDGRVCSGL